MKRNENEYQKQIDEMGNAEWWWWVVLAACALGAIWIAV